MGLIKKMVFCLKQEQLAPVLLKFRETLFEKLREELKDQ